MATNQNHTISFDQRIGGQLSEAAMRAAIEFGGRKTPRRRQCAWLLMGRHRLVGRSQALHHPNGAARLEIITAYGTEGIYPREITKMASREWGAVRRALLLPG